MAFFSNHIKVIIKKIKKKKKKLNIIALYSSKK